MEPRYDVDRFLREVKELLRLADVETSKPLGPDHPNPQVAAALLLRSLGIRPVADPVATLQRTMDDPWVDRDDRSR
ncbi:hypothetical protein [Actinomadura litoris]|uniref:hypothetical protein n=1 Tax=Actinomadura litoris TaxID=2678616 RepID=UPI001FA7464D|nr:hypothetical protein [Actinomadura litoris]